MSKLKFNPQVMLDKIFKKTIYLRPLSDKTFEAVNITGETGQYEVDETGATLYDPTCVVPVRGLKNVRYIAMKFHNSAKFTDMFNGRRTEVTVMCPECQKPHNVTLETPDGQLTEKMLADALDYAEIAGRMQAEGNKEADKKMNMVLLLCAFAVLVGVAIFFKMGGGQ